MNFTSTTARGAASEMVACAYFMAHGYHVFRAVAASCPVDLIVQKPGEALVRVEVKSASRGPMARNWTYVHPTNDTVWDLLAIVHPDGTVVPLPNEGRSPAEVRVAYAQALERIGIPQERPRPNCRNGHRLGDTNIVAGPKGRACPACRASRLADPVPTAKEAS